MRCLQGHGCDPSPYPVGYQRAASVPTAFAHPSPFPCANFSSPWAKKIVLRRPRPTSLQRGRPLIMKGTAPERLVQGESNSPRRETDARGFVLPIPGDIILYAGRWADEDAVGLVEAVRPRAGSDTSVLVDIVEMRDVGAKLFATTRKRRWFDVADVRIALDAKYDSSQDAYQVLSARSGYADVPEMDAKMKAQADAEYAALKRGMLSTTALAGASGTFVAASLFSYNLAAAFGLGSVAGFLYLFLLQLNVDSVGNGETSSSNFSSRLVTVRFIVPALPFLVLGFGGEGPASVLGTQFSNITPQQAGAVILGVLTYKVPLFFRTGSEAVDSLAEMPLNSGTTGMLGVFAGLAARAARGKFGIVEAETAPGIEVPKPTLFVFAGPSGSGKSTLIRRLFATFPNSFAFSVSHTTRKPRDGEKDGVEYYFVDEGEFLRMIDSGDFLEHAVVHGHRYGTSLAAVEEVLESGKCCVLDIDVRGVDAVSKSSVAEPWSPRFIWISPPSLTALKERLESRGSESPESLAKRLDSATREIAFAATSRLFDITIINDNVDDAYKELETYVCREVEVQAISTKT